MWEKDKKMKIDEEERRKKTMLQEREQGSLMRKMKRRWSLALLLRMLPI